MPKKSHSILLRAWPLALCLPALLAQSACRGECEVNAATCDIQGLSITPSSVTILRNGTLSVDRLTVSKDGPWPYFENGLHGQLDLQGGGTSVLSIGLADHPSGMQGVPYSPSLAPLLGKNLMAGRANVFRFDMRHHNRPLGSGSAAAQLTVMVQAPPVLSWQPSAANPLEFLVPSGASATMPSLAVRGVWVGRTGTPLSEILLLRDYKNGFDVTKTEVTRRGGPAVSWSDGAQNPSLFDLWRFGPANQIPRAVYLLQTGDATMNYSVFTGLFQDPEPPKEARGSMMGVALQVMAMAVQTGQDVLGLLVQTPGELRGYVSAFGQMPAVKAIANLATGFPALTQLVAYAEKPDGAAAGVLGVTAAGEPALFLLGAAGFSYEEDASKVLRTSLGIPTTPVQALAVGDVDGDGQNDIAVARNGKVEFYLRVTAGYVRSPSELTLPGGLNPAALAIAQVDGSGGNDLLIADAASQMCAGTPCNHIHVYLNQTLAQ